MNRTLIPASTPGPFAVTRYDKARYYVTDTRTGQFLGLDFSSKRAAVAAADAANERRA